MAIFNESYINSLKKNDSDSINESFGTMLAIGLIFYLSCFLDFALFFYIVKKIQEPIRKKMQKAMALFEANNQDCVPIDDFKKVLYTVKPFTDEPGTERIPQNKIEKFLKKHNIVIGDHCMCYIRNSKLAMYYCMKSLSENTTQIKFAVEDKYSKFEEYYIIAMALDAGWYSSDSIRLADEIIRRYEE